MKPGLKAEDKAEDLHRFDISMAPDSDDETLASLFNSPRVGSGADEEVSVEAESSKVSRASKLRRWKKLPESSESPEASAGEEEEPMVNEPKAKVEDVTEDDELEMVSPPTDRQDGASTPNSGFGGLASRHSSNDETEPPRALCDITFPAGPDAVSQVRQHISAEKFTVLVSIYDLDFKRQNNPQYAPIRLWMGDVVLEHGEMGSFWGCVDARSNGLAETDITIYFHAHLLTKKGKKNWPGLNRVIPVVTKEYAAFRNMENYRDLNELVRRYTADGMEKIFAIMARAFLLAAEAGYLGYKEHTIAIYPQLLARLDRYSGRLLLLYLHPIYQIMEPGPDASLEKYHPIEMPVEKTPSPDTQTPSTSVEKTSKSKVRKNPPPEVGKTPPLITPTPDRSRETTLVRGSNRISKSRPVLRRNVNFVAPPIAASPALVRGATRSSKPQAALRRDGTGSAHPISFSHTVTAEARRGNRTKKVNPLAKRRVTLTKASAKAEIQRMNRQSDEVSKKIVALDARKAVLKEWLAKEAAKEAGAADTADATQQEVEDEHEDEHGDEELYG